MTLCGGIEAGGTKWVCAVGSETEAVTESVRIATTTPRETIANALEFFDAFGPLDALGIGCFGPVELRRSSPNWGRITTTPKPGWADTDVVTPFVGAVHGPIGFDTDVNAAALGEQRLGAARGFETFSYVTVGTGIGGGGGANGALLHGLRHPEVGHMRVPHDLGLDPFPGVCPYHQDCLEGLASGASLRARWGRPAELIDAPEAWELEAHYLAFGLVNLVATLSPERIVLGGGVMRHESLRGRVRELVVEFLGDYIDARELSSAIDDYVVAPDLGERSGVIGAIELGRDVATWR